MSGEGEVFLSRRAILRGGIAATGLLLSGARVQSAEAGKPTDDVMKFAQQRADQVEADIMKSDPPDLLQRECKNIGLMQGNPTFREELRTVGPSVANVCEKAGIAIKPGNIHDKLFPTSLK
jgi:hypothetical protein